MIGTLAGFDAAERPCIDLPAEAGAATGLLARSTAVVRPCDVGRQVAVMFEAGDPTRPVILGLLQESPTAAHIPQPTPGGPAWQVEADGQHVTVQAAETLVFRCGDASITLTKAGKIILRGTYLLSRSSGVNRIKGGAVQIN
ncbi:MAG TPA: DUF6484 domain-containing protein [Pirellulales bacterium]|nr:DUF6484 domain-containing protein [Pirellulales bacterium]